MVDTVGYRSEFVQKLNDEPDQDYKRKEWKTAVYGLCFSLSVICAKVLHAKRDEIHGFLFEKKLMSLESFETNGQVMLHYAWITVWRSHHILFPLLCGFLMTVFTWIMVYLDSSVPGEQPPSPFSPTKYKVRSRHTFHMGYVIAIVNGILVTSLMFINGISL